METWTDPFEEAKKTFFPKNIERKQQNAEIYFVSIIRDKFKEIQETCKEHKVDTLYAFGSVLLDSFSEESDIDLLVSFEQGYKSGSFTQYFDFKEKLEAILGRPVDLICYQAIRNRVFKNEVDNTKKLLYAA